MKTFFSIIIWAYWAACIITFFFIIAIIYLLTFPFDKYNRIPNKCLKGLAWLMLKVNPGWTFEIKGASLGKISEPTIVVANHQSFLDMPLSYLLPWDMKWVSKKALFKIPIFGWIIFMTGHLAIDRKSRRSAKALDKLVEPIKKGIPTMIFPEGTRSSKLKPFKSGAFRLAKQYNFNILPVVINGGGEAMPAGTWKMAYRQHFEITILEPLKSDNFNSANELKEGAFSLIEQELRSLQ
jgi:1-acyl-sn-glycerol-3-phosphate acyltransferase